MTIDLRKLRWAVEASQHRSLRKASEHLNIRQSTLSRSLRDLEAELGVSLFERSNGGTRLTLAGQEFVAGAQRIVQDTTRLSLRLKSLGLGDRGALSVGISTALSAGNARATLVEHHRMYPDVAVRLVDGGTCHLMSDVANRTVDVALVLENWKTWPEKSLRIWSERMVIAVPEAHPLAALEIVHWNRLHGETLLFSACGPSPELLDLVTSKLGSRDKVDLRLHDAGLDRLLAMAGAGFGLLPVLESAAGLSCRGAVFREVHDADGPSMIGLRAIWRADNPNPSLPPFLNMLEERYPDFSVETPVP